MSKLIDLTGQRFEKLTVIERAESRKADTYWVCWCDCGKTIEVRADHLRGGKISNCGCLTNTLIAKGLTKHGMRRTSLYGVWASMIQRCKNEKGDMAKNYHDRGITVYDEWKDFNVFKEWALANGYKEGLTIDREKNDGNYCPENCRWADLITQANNKRSNVRIEYNGETKTLAQWAREYNINYQIFWQRMKRGWSFEQALLTPLRGAA